MRWSHWRRFAGLFTLAACMGDIGGAGAPPGADGGADPEAHDAAASDPDAATVPGSDSGVPDDGTTSGEDGLPAVAEGLAARYPGDVGIAEDPAVILADDFESYADASGLWERWDGVYWDTSITTDPENVASGSQALQFTVPQQEEEFGSGVARTLTQEQDVLYLRYYSKFDTTFDAVGSSHNGGGISAHYYVDGNATPGIPADGLNKFLVEFESWRGEPAEPSPGQMNLYIYHPEQRSEWGDHFFPDGTVNPFTYLPGDFGPDFVPRPNVVPELGRWYCYELMLRANTPGQRDGRVTLWIDGEIFADFPNLRLRDVDTLKIDRFNLNLHIKSNTAAETRKWYDDVVAATSYIGPRSDR